jgi:hypothetical protein
VPRIVPLGALFDCLGVYHDILAGESCEAVWERVKAALQQKPIKAKVLLGICGHDFPHDFQILGYKVVKMSLDKWLTLCLRGDALSEKHGRSMLIHGDERWYLEIPETDDATLVCHLQAGKRAAESRD